MIRTIATHVCLSQFVDAEIVIGSIILVSEFWLQYVRDLHIAVKIQVPKDDIEGNYVRLAQRPSFRVKVPIGILFEHLLYLYD